MVQEGTRPDPEGASFTHLSTCTAGELGKSDPTGLRISKHVVKIQTTIDPYRRITELSAYRRFTELSASFLNLSTFLDGELRRSDSSFINLSTFLDGELRRSDCRGYSRNNKNKDECGVLIEALAELLNENESLAKQNLELQNLTETQQRRNMELQNENDSIRKELQEGQVMWSSGGRNSMVGADGHRWYWRNRRERRWEEFDQANNDKLEQKWLKAKLFAHVQVDRNWQHVTFDSMKMQKINFPDETEVKRSGSKPVYEGIGGRQKEQQRIGEIGERSDPDGSDIDNKLYDEGGSPSIKEGVAYPDYISSNSWQVHDTSEPIKRKKNWEKNAMQPQCHNDTDSRKRKAKQEFLRKRGDDRTDPDGSDTDYEKCDTEKPHIGKRDVTSPHRDSSSDRLQPCQIREADHFPSDDDIESKHRRKHKKHGKHDKRKERKHKQQLLGREGDERSDPDGSDTDHEKYDSEIPSIGKRDVTLPHRGSSSDRVQQCQTREADHFPSDDDSDESKRRRKRKKNHGKNDNRNKNGREKDDKHDKRKADDDNSSDEDRKKTERHHHSHRRGTADERQTKSQHSTENQQMQQTKSLTEKQYFLSHASAVHFEAHHGGVHFLHAFAQANTDNVRPLHIAASLGLKRNVSYLLQAGWNLDEKDEHGATPVQRAHNQSLADYMKKFLPEETDPVEQQPNPHGAYDECMVFPIIMDRVDLSTRKVYLPSYQLRKTFRRRMHKQVLFISPYVTTYEVVCQHQVYGVLWLLGQYGRDMLTCLNDICLPDWSIQQFRDSKTGKLDVTAWLRNKGLHQQQHNRHYHVQRQSEGGTLPNWIQSILEGNVDDFKREFQRDIEHPNDGWTPLHFAILIHQHDLVRFLLETQRRDLQTRTNTLLPQFILDEMKHRCQFEYNYVYKYTTGFTPLLLATFIGNNDAIDILGEHMDTWQLEMEDCLTLAYCDDTESKLLKIMSGLGEKHVHEKYSLDVKLHSVYEKDCPIKRILIGSSNGMHRRIEENLPHVRLILDNENIIRKFLKPRTTKISVRDSVFLGEVIESNADLLWKRHSNLNAIMPGHTSSLSEYQTDEVMVVLHCSHKGFIHTHELPFNKYLYKDGKCVRVHVIQGSFQLGPLTGRGESAHDSESEKGKIQTGYQIKYVPTDMMATLGMMVEDLDGNTGILTCAHTFLNEFLNHKSYDRLYDRDSSLPVDVLLRKPELLVSGHDSREVGAQASVNQSHEDMDLGEDTSSRSDSDCEMADAE